MSDVDKVNILLVDDQPAKLISYEVILRELGENLLTANSAREAFEHLLKTEIAVVLVDVYMPELDGFELARMIREHPRFQRTAIIFISAVLLTDLDFLRGYECGAVDYVPVPVVPEVLRAKVKVFAELYRKTRQLELLNRNLERRVAERTAELRASEERLRLAFEAAQMGWWDYDIVADKVTWSPSLVRMMGRTPESFGGTLEGALAHVHPEDRERFLALVREGIADERSQSCELRFVRPDGSIRWSHAAGQVIRDGDGRSLRFAGVDLDITARKQADERQLVLVNELDHRAKNLLAVVQSVLRLSHAGTVPEFVEAVDGRIRALGRAHSLLSESRWQGVDFGRIVSEEVAPFKASEISQVSVAGPELMLLPVAAQSLALAIHELATNAVKYGALSVPQGRVALTWELQPETMILRWTESGGPQARKPSHKGFGTKVIVASIEGHLDGRADFDWRPEGMRCTFDVPRHKVVAARSFDGHSPRADQTDAALAPVPIGGCRIMVVEDEALLRVATKEMLEGLGFAVVGPLSTMADAIVAADKGDFDGAVLDVNIGGQPIFPVAELLIARGIPFVFVTGYSPDRIDRRYGRIPVLQKPIELHTLRQLFRVDGAAVAAPAEDPAPDPMDLGQLRGDAAGAAPGAEGAALAT
jgi:PAS domain S-box-containing protein